MAFAVWLAQANRNPGSYTLGPVAVPAGKSVVRMQLLSTGFTDPARVVTATLRASFDGGLTYEDWGGGCTISGGTFVNRAGAAYLPEWDVNLAAGRYPTHLTCTVVISGGAVNCGVQGEIS